MSGLIETVFRQHRRGAISGSAACVTLALAMLVAAAESVPAQQAAKTDAARGGGKAEPSLRNILLQKLPPGTKIIGLDYTVEIENDQGVRQPLTAPADQYPFKVGDRFGVTITPQDDVFVYVFTQGPSGKRAVLLPESKDKPLQVKSGEKVSLPLGGASFEFAPPAGDEKLRVVALRQHNPALLDPNAPQFKTAMDGIENDRGPVSRGPRKLVKTEQPPAGGVSGVETPPESDSPYGTALGINSDHVLVDISLSTRARPAKAK
jgi:hypothetical protein